jgi:hypothetical protein
VLTRDVAAMATGTRIENHAIDDPYSDHDGVLVRLEPTPSVRRAIVVERDPLSP